MNYIYLGGRAMRYLAENLVIGHLTRFKTDCKKKKKLIELCSQIIMRFPLDEARVLVLLETIRK